MSATLPWKLPLSGRDPAEENRVSTPLELLFDLSFVVAVAAAAAALHHDLASGDFGGLLGYVMIFFAIWWAWLNYSWFASAYDTGDVVFRLMTFVVLSGVLVLASGVPRIFRDVPDFTIVVVGYVIMRTALIPMWLRVARDHPQVRGVALRYVGGIVMVQLLWIGWLWVPAGSWTAVAFVALALFEMTIPYVAETSGGESTPWHPEHIVERFSLFTIIVLGEVILATTQAISATLDGHGFSADLAMVIIGGLLLVLAMWWIYFKNSLVAASMAATASSSATPTTFCSAPWPPSVPRWRRTSIWSSTTPTVSGPAKPYSRWRPRSASICWHSARSTRSQPAPSAPWSARS